MVKKENGFTLIELMVVVAIIGILAAIAIPAYQDYTVRAKVSEGVVLADSLKTNIADYYYTNARFPPNNASAGLALNTSYATAIVKQVDVTTSGKIEVQFKQIGANANSVSAGDKIVFVPTANSVTSLVWECISRSTVAARYRPGNCR